MNVLVLIATFLLIGGCGGSKHVSSQATTTANGATQSTATGRATTTSHKTAAGSTRGHPPVPGSGGATHVVVPSTFTIHPGDKLVPPVISVPAFFAIQLTVISGDHKAHTVIFRGPPSVTIKVPAGGRQEVLLPGLKNGQYPVVVDGASRGSLMIGGEPGP
jgi:hypothetical protein